MSEQNSQLTQKVQKWLNTQGYPLEMRVAKKLRDAGLEVRQGWHYQDQDTDELREIDIIASRTGSFGMSNVSFTVECKKNSRPWVLLTSESTLENINRVRALAKTSERAREYLIQELINHEIKEKKLLSIPWFVTPDRVGYALTESLVNGKDTPFSACNTSVKAAMWVRDNFVEQYGSIEVYSCVFPTIVLEGKLYEGQLNQYGELDVNEIESGVMFFSRPMLDEQFALIRIVTEKSVDKFVKQARKIVDVLSPAWEGDIEAETGGMSFL